MANPNSSKPAGVWRLPPGFRFHPTDEELVLQYLKRKAFSFPLPVAFIPEIDLGKYHPWDLPGGREQERYFFHLRAAKYPNGCRVNRAIGSGYWKATGRDKPVVASKSNEVVGLKKVLVFYHGKSPAGFKTDWFMHEYRLAGADASFCSFGKKNKLVHGPVQTMKDWVLCRIFMKGRPPAAGDCEREEVNNQDRDRALRLINFIGDHENSRSISTSSSSSSSSTSGLSCVTEQSDRHSNGEVSSPT